MSTRAYLTIISGKNVIDAAYYPSSAYPSNVGIEALNAIRNNNFDGYLAQVREDFPEEKRMLEGVERSLYIRGEDNADHIFDSYAYEFDIDKGRMNLYHYGNKALTVTSKNLELCKAIFEMEDALFYPLCLDEKSMTLKKDFYKEIRGLLKIGATEKDFQTILDSNPSILYLDSGRICDVAGRDFKTNFMKRVQDSNCPGYLTFIVNDHFNDNNFRISIQTPFYRASVPTSKLRSAGAAEKELAKIVRERPDDVRGTKELFMKINAYKDSVSKIFDDQSISLEDRADKAHALRLDMVAELNATKGQFRIIGPTIEMLDREIVDCVHSNYRHAKYVEEQKAEEQKPSFETLVTGAAERAGNSHTHEHSNEKELDPSF